MGLEHERHRLACGATVLARPLAANDIVAVQAYLPMGPLWEADDEAGLSRLVQEVLPRGTRRRSAHELQEALADLGAELDTGTGPDLGSIRLRAVAGCWEAALDLFLEVVTEPAFDADEVATEVARTLGVLAARRDQLMTRAMDLFRERFYGTHPFHKPVVGYPETVRDVERDRVTAAARRFYRPVPPVVVAVGRFDPAVLVERLEASFGNVPIVPAEPRPAPPGPGGGTGRLELDRDAAYLVHGCPAPSLLDPEYPAARVLDAILGGSMDSRLFVELREKRALAYQVSSLYDDRLEGSFLAAYIVTDPARVPEAAAGLATEFRRLAETPPAADEVERARRHLRGRHLMAVETNAAQAARIGGYEVHGLGRDFGDRFLAAIGEVTPAAVKSVAERWLALEPTRAIVVPPGVPDA